MTMNVSPARQRSVSCAVLLRVAAMGVLVALPSCGTSPTTAVTVPVAIVKVSPQAGTVQVGGSLYGMARGRPREEGSRHHHSRT